MKMATCVPATNPELQLQFPSHVAPYQIHTTFRVSVPVMGGRKEKLDPAHVLLLEDRLPLNFPC